MGIYLATTPSAALDRASLQRGYAQSLHPRGTPNGWDCPVVIGMGLNIEECGLHRRLANGAELRRHTIHHNRGPGAPVDLEECQVLDVRIFTPLYNRYQQLPQCWGQLERGEMVLCRARLGRPEDFFLVVTVRHCHAAAQRDFLMEFETMGGCRPQVMEQDSGGARHATEITIGRGPA